MATFQDNDSQRAADWTSQTSAVQMYLTSINLGKYYPIFVHTGLSTMEGLLELSNDLRRSGPTAIEADLDALQKNGMEIGDRRTFKRELVKLTEEQTRTWENEGRSMEAERLEMELMEAEEEQTRRLEEEALRKLNDMKARGKSLLPIGRKLALYSPTLQRFLTMNDSFNVVVNPDSSLSQPSHMIEQQSQRTNEQFTVVDGGDNMIALYNTHHKCFLRLGHNGAVDGKGGPCDADKLPLFKEWPSERFHVVDCNDGQIALHSPCNHFLRMTVNGTVDGNGGQIDYDKLPSDWMQERMFVVVLSLTCVTTLTGHTSHVLSLIQLADGRLCSSSADFTIKVWEVDNKKCVITLCGHKSYVYSIIQLHDGRVASCGGDKTIKLWNLTSKKCEMSLVGHTECVYSLRQLINPRRLVSCSGDTYLKVWDLKIKQCIITLSGHTEFVRSVIQLENGRLYSCGGDKTINVWDLNKGTDLDKSCDMHRPCIIRDTTIKCLFTLVGHTQYVTAVIQLADNRVCSCSADYTIMVWEKNSQKCVMTLIGHTSHVLSLIQMADNRLCSCSADNSIKFWDLNSKKCVMTLDNKQCVYSLLQLQDGRICSGSDTTVKVWA